MVLPEFEYDAADIWWDEPTDHRVVVGDKDAFHFDGSQWRTATDVEDSGSDSVVTDRILEGVWGRAWNDIIAVGRQRTTLLGTILAFNGTTWSEIDTPSATLTAIDGNASEVVAVGEGGLIVSPPTWAPASTPVTDDLSDVDFCPDGSIWVVGENGVILTRNGSIWEQVASTTTADLESVACVSASEAWARRYGVLLHWDGVEWSAADSSVLGNCRILEASGREIFGGGWYGQIVALHGVLFIDGFESGDDDLWSSSTAP